MNFSLPKRGRPAQCGFTQILHNWIGRITGHNIRTHCSTAFILKFCKQSTCLSAVPIVALFSAVLSVNVFNTQAAHYTNDGSYFAVSNHYYNAVMGDVIFMKPGTTGVGTNRWTNALVMYKPVELIGYAGTNTVIEDYADTFNYLFYVGPTNEAHLTRLSNFRIDPGPGAVVHANGVIAAAIDGTTNQRIDHVYFNFAYGRFFYPVRWSTNRMQGLFDHNWARYRAGHGPFWDAIPDPNISHFSFAGPIPWGSPLMGWTLEYNDFYSVDYNHLTDGRAGERFVFRFNNNHNGDIENHSFGGNAARGHRAIEAYGNTNSGGSGQSLFFIRGGTAIIVSNSVSDWGSLCTLNYERSTDPFPPYGQANGTNEWDLNGALVASGTHTGANGAAVLADSEKAWDVDAFIGYSIINYGTNNQLSYSGTHSGTNNSPNVHSVGATWTLNQWGTNYYLWNTVSNTYGIISTNSSTNVMAVSGVLFKNGDTFEIRRIVRSGVLVANTATTATCRNPIAAVSKPLFNTGDQYEIRIVTRYFDGIGNGWDLTPLSGGGVTNPIPVGFNQTNEPVFIAYNTGVTNVGNGLYTSIVAGRDWTNGTALPPGWQPFGTHPLANKGFDISLLESQVIATGVASPTIGNGSGGVISGAKALHRPK